MQSIKFPNMLNNSRLDIIEDEAALEQNAYLTLMTEKGSFIYDPFMGIRLKRYLFEQNTTALQDILKDEIYEQLSIFMPQLSLTRNNITITRERAKLNIYIKATNRLDFTPVGFNLVLEDY